MAPPGSETSGLHAAVRDIVALSALSALWDSADPDRMAAQLGDALLRVMSIEGAFVRIGASHDDRVGEAYRLKDWDEATPKPTTAELSAYIATFADAPPPIESPSGSGLPLRLAVSPIGGVGGVVAMSHRADFPNEIDRMLLGIAANQAAIALDRAKLLREREQALAALAEQSRALATVNHVGQILAAQLELGSLVQELCDAATSLSGAEFGAIFYNARDERGEFYQLFALSGVDRERFQGFPLPRNTEIFGPTFRGEGVIRLDDVLADPRYGKNAPYEGMPPGHLPVRSYLAMPLFGRGGEVFGGLFLGHQKPGMFLESHEKLLTGIVAQASTAIANA